MDNAIDKLAWEGQVPIAFSLATPCDEAERPDDVCYLMVPRVAYLPFCFEQLAEHFGLPYLTQQLSAQRHDPGFFGTGDYSGEGAAAAAASSVPKRMLWFEHGGAPLKWHLPVGVLYDLSGQTNSDEPWEIKVHTQDYPLKVLAACTGPDDVERIFLSRLKESTFIKHETINLDALMSSGNLKQMWSGLLHGRFDDFNDINSRLTVNPNLPGEYFLRFPFVAYVVTTTDDQRELTEVVQEPFPILDKEGVCWTLGDLMQYLFGERYVADRSRVLIHGISPPSDTPLQWLARHLCHADNFCHLVVEL